MSTQIDAYPLESPTNGAAAIGLNSSGVTRRLSMGSAAQADLTTSPTDTTAGRVMKVGDGGLLSGGWSLIGGDMNALTPQVTRFFAHAGGTAPLNIPVADQQGLGFVIYGWEDDKAAFQFWSSVFSGDTYIRRQDAVGVWSSWARLITEKDYPSDTAETEVTSLDNGWTGTVRYIKRAGMVTITADLTGDGATGDNILTLPSNYRPANTVASTGRGTTLTYATSGGLVVASGRDPNVDFTLTYPVI